jgi:hypothetical protein
VAGDWYHNSDTEVGVGQRSILDKVPYLVMVLLGSHLRGKVQTGGDLDLVEVDMKWDRFGIQPLLAEDRPDWASDRGQMDTPGPTDLEGSLVDLRQIQCCQTEGIPAAGLLDTQDRREGTEGRTLRRSREILITQLINETHANAQHGTLYSLAS